MALRGFLSLVRIITDHRSATYQGSQKRVVVVSADVWNSDASWPNYTVLPRTTEGGRSSLGMSGILGCIVSPAADVRGSRAPMDAVIDCLQILKVPKGDVVDHQIAVMPRRRMVQVSKRLRDYISANSVMAWFRSWLMTRRMHWTSVPTYLRGELIRLVVPGASPRLSVVVSHSQVNKLRAHPRGRRGTLLTVVLASEWDGTPEEAQGAIILEPASDHVHSQVILHPQTIRTYDSTAIGILRYSKAESHTIISSSSLRLISKACHDYLGARG